MHKLFEKPLHMAAMSKAAVSSSLNSHGTVANGFVYDEKER